MRNGQCVSKCRFLFLIVAIAVLGFSPDCKEKRYYMDRGGNLYAALPKDKNVVCSVAATTFIIAPASFVFARKVNGTMPTLGIADIRRIGRRVLKESLHAS